MKHFFLHVAVFPVLLLMPLVSLSAEDAMDNYLELRDKGYQDAVQQTEDSVSQRDAHPSTLDEYVSYALLHNPGLKASFTAWKAALEEVARVHSLPDPQISYAYYIRNVETRVGPQRHRLEISQMFPWFGTLETRSRVNLENARMQWERFREQQLALKEDVKTAYYDLYFIDRRLRILRDNMTLLSSLEEVARIGYSAGTIEHGALVKLQIELARLEERLMSVTDRRTPLVVRLNSLLNRPPEAVVNTDGGIDRNVVGYDDNELAALMRENSPVLAVIDRSRVKAERSRELADKESMPSFGVGFSYIETGETDMAGVGDSGKDPIMAMVTVSLPVWDGKYDARKRKAELEIRGASERLAREYDGLRVELETTLFSHRDATRRIELYRDSLIPRAEQSLAVTRKAFTAGSAGYLDVIDAQRTLLEFQLAVEEAEVNRAKAAAGIERLAGVPVTVHE